MRIVAIDLAVHMLTLAKKHIARGLNDRIEGS